MNDFSYSPSPESLSPQLSSVESLRSSIPEEHRKLFDSLLQDIKDYCKANNLPFHLLSSSEAFTKAVGPIHPSLLEPLKLRMERLAHLIKHKEPMPQKETLPEHLKEIERLYHLEEQYASQVSLLREVGILDELDEIQAIDGKHYPVPTLEQIAEQLYEQREELEIKRDQGFTKLVLVPFGMNLGVCFFVLREYLISYKRKHPEFTRGIPSLPNKSDKSDWIPVHIDGKDFDVRDSSLFVYRPNSFDRYKHQGKTKAQILEGQAQNPHPFQGWTVRLFQPSIPNDPSSPGIASIPREGQGNEYGQENPRLDIESAPMSQCRYLSIVEDAKNDPNSPYFRESGLTPEDWIFAFLTHLQETGKTLDNFLNKDESTCGLVGAFSPSLNAVPIICWMKISSQVCFGVDATTTALEIQGARFAVSV